MRECEELIGKTRETLQIAIERLNDLILVLIRFMGRKGMKLDDETFETILKQ